MGNYVDRIRKRAVEKRQELERDPAATEEDFVCMKITEKFLAHKAAFAVSQPLASLAVLKFLGYTEEEMRDLYYKLVFEQSTQGQYRYVDPDKVKAQPEATQLPEEEPEEEKEEPDEEEEPNKEESREETWEAVKPEPEEPRPLRIGRLLYWENGMRCQTEPLPLDPGHETYYYTKYCFGKQDAKGRLHTLIGNEWRYGGPFRTYYFDAQYDCQEVDYILEPEKKTD